MGGLFSTNSRHRSRKQDKSKTKHFAKSRDSSSSSDDFPIKPTKRKNETFEVRDGAIRGGNVKAKMNMFNNLEKEVSQPIKSHKSPSSKNQHKKHEKRKGFDYKIDNRNKNEKVVTINLDIPTLTSSEHQPQSYRPIAASTTPTRMPTKKEFEAACIKAHNQYRQCHDVGPLQRDSKLTSMAQEWANKLAKLGRLQHSSNRGYGENVAFTSKNEPSGLEICKMWYDEIKDYKFHSPGFSGNTGHFTQVVWKGTTHVGIGIATGSKGTFVVANYKPAGNMTNPGYFKENVPKQKSKPTVVERRRSSSSSSSSSDEDSRKRSTGAKASSGAKSKTSSSAAPKPGKTVDTKTEIYTENGVRKKKTIVTTTTVTVTGRGTQTSTKTETKIETLPDDDKSSSSLTDKFKRLRSRKDSDSSSSSDDDDGGKNVMSSSDTRKFRKECLERHNELRRRHGAAKLKENKKLQEAAQRHANRMLRREKLMHTDMKKYGENVAMKMPRPSGSDACDMWYEEKKDYDFKKSVFSGKTGHFTQVVWNGSTEIGVGVASDAKGRTYVACFYNPPGNVQGGFAENVKRG